jgi:hypothetical protein
MAKVTTLTVYKNWDEDFNVVNAAAWANEDFDGSDLVSPVTFHKGLGEKSFVMDYELNGSTVNETYNDTSVSRFDERVRKSPTVFFVEVDEAQSKMTSILSQIDGNNTNKAAIKREYNRLLFNRQHEQEGKGGIWKNDGNGVGGLFQGLPHWFGFYYQQ